MGKIEIDINALNVFISELKTLQSNWLNHEVNSPETVGGGGTVNQLEEIAKVYAGLQIKMGALLSGTISFLDYTKKEYEEQDKAIATKMKRERD
ncbi:hypothetical protein [Roseburia sp. 499]|uniref:hypothetical protein n=1 Tax=Roseburia sp. 499 TaxID=1261634 RepID=UPI0009513D6B|nr:hypothetical protein [Roseburia sp. 499]WVK70915.1 hypothetical protein BIV20_05115 [Roseburia sp. 499]